jgi:hypothetical protein
LYSAYAYWPPPPLPPVDRPPLETCRTGQLLCRVCVCVCVVCVRSYRVRVREAAVLVRPVLSRVGGAVAAVVGVVVVVVVVVVLVLVLVVIVVVVVAAALGVGGRAELARVVLLLEARLPGQVALRLGLGLPLLALSQPTKRSVVGSPGGGGWRSYLVERAALGGGQRHARQVATQEGRIAWHSYKIKIKNMNKFNNRIEIKCN